MPAASRRFTEFAPAIAELPTDRQLTALDVVVSRFRLEQEGDLEIYYAPMEWVRPKARLIAVGITPGLSTMLAAFQSARESMAAGASRARVLDEVKRVASFSKARGNLARMLDELGANRWLGLPHCHELWHPEAAALFQPTSAIRYPVFKRSQNYSGHGPKPPSSPMLARWLRDELAPELAMLPEALIVPLGRSVDTAVAMLIREDLLDDARCLVGFPHPSGLNVGLPQQWATERAQLKRKSSSWFREHN
jgi:hypothetical protein